MFNLTRVLFTEKNMPGYVFINVNQEVNVPPCFYKIKKETKTLFRACTANFACSSVATSVVLIKQRSENFGSD